MTKQDDGAALRAVADAAARALEAGWSVGAVHRALANGYEAAGYYLAAESERLAAEDSSSDEGRGSKVR